MRTGRFGWKANVATLAHQTAGAFLGDIGITSRQFPARGLHAAPEGLPGRTARRPGRSGIGPEIDDSTFGNVVFYQSTLAPAARRDAAEPQVLRGQRLFAQAQCAVCHRPSYVTGEGPFPALTSPKVAGQRIWPYTDLLLHDMGEALADDRPDFEANGREWKTPPLWGIGLIPDVNGHQRLLARRPRKRCTRGSAVAWWAGRVVQAAGAALEPRRSRGAGQIRGVLVKCLFIVAALVATQAHAQADWQRVAVPYYTAEAYAQGEALDLEARTQRFATESRRLVAALNSLCSGAPAGDARTAYRADVAAWDALAALSTGPLIERRSARSIDFMPVRREQLARAVASAPVSAADMERIGAPARGFAALEALLWPEVPAADTPECRYSAALAADLEREAAALAAASAQRTRLAVEGEEAAARVVETVNQWTGGIELLRWAFLRKPLDVAQTREAAAPEFPRAASGLTTSAWAERWRTLRSACVLGDRPTPVPGQAPVPFETMLRGLGLNPLADRVVESAAKADAVLRGLDPRDTARVRDAAAALGNLGALVQDEVATALNVRIGFSDADGD